MSLLDIFKVSTIKKERDTFKKERDELVSLIKEIGATDAILAKKK
jgi:hypothetical protein